MPDDSVKDDTKEKPDDDKVKVYQASYKLPISMAHGMTFDIKYYRFNESDDARAIEFAKANDYLRSLNTERIKYVLDELLEIRKIDLK